MRKQKVPAAAEVNLPYASTAASFFGDQGMSSGSSFLGKLFSGGTRRTSMNTSGVAPAVAPVAPVGAASSVMNNAGRGGFSGSASRTR